MNSTINWDYLPFECDDTYSGIIGVLGYVATICYMIPAILLHCLIIRCVLITHKKQYGGSSFFLIFVTDSVASLAILLSDMTFFRLFLYVSPLCPLVAPHFWTPSILLRVLFYIVSHARLAKCITQIFLVLNRMSCVLVPTYYMQKWKTLTPISIICVAVIPFFGTWNVLLSPRILVVPILGGFGPAYVKFYDGAALSLFQSIFILTALGFTVVCTTVTLYKLFFLAERIKSAERSLCLTNVVISLTFLLVAATQLAYVVLPEFRYTFWLFIAQYLAFDAMNVGSAVIMLASNAQLRESIFSYRKLHLRIFQVSSHNGY